jgi:hypothetical protein
MTPDLRAAALYVCGHAHTVNDAALLLDALGLVDGGALTWPTVPAGLDPRNPRNIAASQGPGARK